MEYYVKRIKSREDIRSCQRFCVDQFRWVDGPKPETYGYMGYLEGRGLYVRMYCREKNPRRECVGPKGRFNTTVGKRVWDDSAMEVFLGFADGDGVIRRDSLYLNFELNANGVLYAKCGRGRADRRFIPEEAYEAASPQAEIGEELWETGVLFPEDYLNALCGVEIGQPGTEFYCNFYKISETPEIEHYGAFAEIDSEKPNFHAPECFAKAIIE